jgi:hypothetical protein
LADAIIAHLTTVCFLAAVQFRAVTWRVACYNEFALALVPWEGVVRVVGSDTLTLKITMMALIRCDDEFLSVHIIAARRSGHCDCQNIVFTNVLSIHHHNYRRRCWTRNEESKESYC